MYELAEHHAVDAGTIDGFARDGHAVVRGLASADEVAHFAPIIEAAAIKYAHETRPLDQRDTYGKAFLQVPNLWWRDPAVRPFVLARRFAQVAADLLGVDGVRLYHDQALFKEPGGGLTPWHQDQNYWPLATDRTITMWMPLVPLTTEIGGMTFASGTHLDGDLGSFLIGDPSQNHFEQLVRERDLPLRSYGAFAAGDATFHAGWTLHSAPANPTATMRSVMTIIYYADGTRVGEADHPARRLDQALWLGGRNTGDLADSESNPLLYHRTITCEGTMPS
jgi:ectoine hydroxylase-related dioxygenase (phytanoyl-CoA dioxygenase family)